MRRYLYIIIGAVALVVVIGVIFFVLSLNKNSTTPPGTTGTLPQAGNQTGGTGSTGGTGDQTGSTSGNDTSSTAAGPQGLIKSFGILSEDQALDYFVDAGNNVFVIKTDGTIEEISAGQATVLSANPVPDVIAADFSYDGKKALISSGDPSAPQTSIFDVASKSWSVLPQGFISPRWSPNDYRIAYLTAAAGTYSIVTLDASSTKKIPTVMLSLNAGDLSLDWLNKSQLLLSTRPSVSVDGSVWAFDMVQKSLSPLVFEKAGAESVWSPANSSGTEVGLVFSANSNARGGTLQLADSSGNIIQNMRILTLPSKCVFSDALYCAVPRDQNKLSFSHLPDDYEQRGLFTSDNIYRINLSTGAIDTVWNDPNQNIDVSDAKFINNTLFFTNRYDQKLYGLVLN